jgi:5-methylcytosine-specific restriction protein A
VPNCGFDFAKTYGETGKGYAHVHHTIPLNEAPNEGMVVPLDKLAIVCANCHAMIHRGGVCRPMDKLLPPR